MRIIRDVRSRLWGEIARRLAFEGLLYRRLRRAARRSPLEVVHIHGWGCGEDPPGALNQLNRLGSDPAIRQRMEAASLARFARGTFTRAAVADGHLEAYRLAAELHDGLSQAGAPNTAFEAL